MKTARCSYCGEPIFEVSLAGKLSWLHHYGLNNCMSKDVQPVILRSVATPALEQTVELEVPTLRIVRFEE